MQFFTKPQPGVNLVAASFGVIVVAFRDWNPISSLSGNARVSEA
jgi:hypothetical protein